MRKLVTISAILYNDHNFLWMELYTVALGRWAKRSKNFYFRRELRTKPQGDKIFLKSIFVNNVLKQFQFLDMNLQSSWGMGCLHQGEIDKALFSYIHDIQSAPFANVGPYEQVMDWDYLIETS